MELPNSAARPGATTSTTAKRHQGFLKDLSHLIQSAIALGFFYDLVAHTLNRVYAASTLAGRALTVVQVDQNHALLPTIYGEPGRIGIELCKAILEPGGGVSGDSICVVIVVCLLLAVVAYYILDWVCDKQWVQEPVQIKECWEELVWWKPWTWIWVVVCTVKEIFRWVLKIICRWRKIAIFVLVVVCIVAGVIIAA